MMVARASSDPRHRAPRHPRAGRAVVALIRLYQVLRAGRMSPCRFVPSCSEFALEAVERHGAGRGLLLAGRRLSRCRPGGGFGYDPVPDLREERS